MADLNFYEWTQEVNKAIRKRTLKAGRNINLEEHDDKTIIHSDFDGGGGGGEQLAFVCKIINHMGYGVYTVEVHPKGKDSNEGIYNAVATLLNQQYDAPLQSGTWVIAVIGEITNT